MDVPEYNREAWDRQVESGNPWTVPVGPEVIEAARRGGWEVLLTETKPVPRAWFPQMAGTDVLCLASGGGQQAPTFAVAGASVTVLDNSPRQLAQDRFVAERELLDLETIQCDMRDLSAFADGSFDLVFQPVSNLFVPEVRPIWNESYRVLRRGASCSPVSSIPLSTSSTASSWTTRERSGSGLACRMLMRRARARKRCGGRWSGESRSSSATPWRSRSGAKPRRGS